MGRFTSAQEFIPCLLIRRACLLQRFVSRNNSESDLQDGVKLARSLSLFGRAPLGTRAGTKEWPGPAGIWAKGFQGR